MSCAIASRHRDARALSHVHELSASQPNRERAPDCPACSPREMSPPMPRAISRLIERPSPVPSTREAWLFSTCTNGSNTASSRSAGCRRQCRSPCSSTKSSRSGAIARVDASRAARRRELARVREEVEQNLLELLAIGRSLRAPAARRSRSAARARRAAARSSGASPCTMSLSEIGLQIVVDAPRLDAREIQQIVDQSQQMLLAARARGRALRSAPR